MWELSEFSFLLLGTYFQPCGFVKECLKRFGTEGDKIYSVYSTKDVENKAGGV